MVIDPNIEFIATMFATVCAMSAWSWLYRDSRWFRLAETTLVGSFLAYTLDMGVRTLNLRVVGPIGRGELTVGMTILIILGLIYFTRAIPPLVWVSRYSVTVLTAIGLGLVVRSAVPSQIVQLTTMGSFTAPGMKGINNIVIAVGTLSVMSYFIMTHRHKGPLGVLAKTGRYTLMIGFGVAMGTYLLSNMAFSLGNVREFLEPPKRYLIPVAFVVLLYGIWDSQRKKEA
jgi:hypothetical protein